MVKQSVKRAPARRKHPFGVVTRPRPRYTANHQTPFGGAARELGIDSDLRLRAMLNNRVSKHVIRNWRRGKNKAPQWAILVLEAECDRISEAILRARYWLSIAS